MTKTGSDRPQKDTLQTGCITLHEISWEKFSVIDSTLADISAIRSIYLDGVLEIMTPLSEEHEYLKSTIGLLLEAYLREKNIRFYVRGSATLGSQALGGRKEPDESYNLETRKTIPDLVIEVIITSGSIDILEIYRRLRVPEVWIWRGGNLEVYSLGESQYQPGENSRLLPDLDLKLFTECVRRNDQYDAVNAFIQAIRQQN
ncbi:Uma2 family endonuclease [Kamptonema cortianum]|uniref:Uma2 family endonuclease n=1 Tax=Geitlerinema calcuttense NRMC-F 0142 TaxID=2922238 RepID=A0ABT7LZR4_9CYAN|nr:Uma2 family endonuclease [Geitlerinema calcuttense]MCD8485477.1 Uma2 family endonuclease [Desertifilum sp.]MDK3160184.1 Uma2 family endonuclease [Kamptonema cortianum]MDL5057507.1 Uma2 family endonuclease [Geitlerinema calcuttense NRMC-F 0142]